MNKLRKARRTIERPHKPKRWPAADIILFIGVILLVIGLLSLGMNYLFYSSAEHAPPVTRPAGRKYPDKQTLEANIKDTAIISLGAAGLGLVLAGSALLTKFVQKKL